MKGNKMRLTPLKIFGPAFILGTMAIGVTGCGNKQPEEKDYMTEVIEKAIKKQQQKVTNDSIEYFKLSSDTALVKAQFEKLAELNKEKGKLFKAYYGYSSVKELLNLKSTKELRALLVSYSLDYRDIEVIERAEKTYSEKDFRKWAAKKVIVYHELELEKIDGQYKAICKSIEDLRVSTNSAKGNKYTASKKELKEMEEFADTEIQRMYDKLFELWDKYVETKAAADATGDSILIQKTNQLAKEYQAFEKEVLAQRAAKGYTGKEWCVKSKINGYEFNDYFLMKAQDK